MIWTGAVVHPIDHHRSRRFGSCVAVGNGQWFLTAAHVLDTANEQGYEPFIGCAPGLDDPVPVDDVRVHPDADVALLHAPHDNELRSVRDTFAPRPGFPVTVRWRGPNDWHTRRAVAIKTPAINGVECFAFGPAADRGASGAAVTSDYGAVWGMVTSTANFSGMTVGVAVALAPLWEWVQQTVGGESYVGK